MENEIIYRYYNLLEQFVGLPLKSSFEKLKVNADVEKLILIFNNTNLY